MKFNAPNIANYCTKYNKLNINFVWDMQLIPYNLYVLEMFLSYILNRLYQLRLLVHRTSSVEHLKIDIHSFGSVRIPSPTDSL